jgi:hypothetical protein
MAQFHPAAQMVQDDVGAMQRALDAAFTRVDGPFRSFEESLVAFARANYGLRLANGRCAQSGRAGCTGLHYDPEGLYAAPSLEAALEFEGAATTFNGTIPGSFGSDFVEVSLDLTAHGEPLMIQVQGNDAGVRFRVQVWRLAPGIGAPRAVTPAPELVPQNGEGTFVYAIPAVDWQAYNRLAVIITRVDANENEDPLGAYQITFIT